MQKDIITEKQDLTYLSWTRTRNSSGTAGSFLKAYSELGGKKLITSFPITTMCVV